MKASKQKLLGTGILMTAVGLMAWAGVSIAQPPPAPGDQPPALPGAQQPQPGEARSVEVIMAEMQQEAMRLQGVLEGPQDIADAEKRRENRDQVMPVLRRMGELAGEGAQAAPDPMMAEQLQGMRRQMLSLLVAYDDQEARRELEGDDSLSARGSLLVGRFLQAEDKDGRKEIVEEASKLAEEHGDEPAVFEAMVGMLSFAQDSEVRKQIEDIVVELDHPMAEMLRDQIESQRQMEQRFVGEPMTIEGKTVDGETFSTEQWKWKVVLVDFWATWCGPCLAEKPRLQKAYEEYHDQGFEIIGVSNDQRAEDLERYIEENPEMAWPQLFDRDKPGWHALAEQFGVQGIPTWFVIDRNGVCRSITARENLEELIPKLLAEEPNGERREESGDEDRPEEPAQQGDGNN